MGGSFSGAAMRGHRAATHTLIAAAVALTVLALFAGTAAARTAPTVVITSAPDAVTADASPRFAFETRDATDDARVECRVDDALVACATNGTAGSYRASALTDGRHVFSVRATTAADATDDDWGPAATYDFRVDRTAPAVTIGAPSPHTAVAAPVPPAVAQPAAASAPAPARVPRLEIGEACTEVSAARANATVRLAGRTAIVRFRAPAAARYARVTLRRGSGRRHGAVIGTLADARVARAGATRTSRIALTSAQRRLIRSGTARLAIAYGTCRSQAGEWHWITPAGG
jgi:hypothetical protein